jgi:broad specificity phosphatase PhoE
MIKIAFFRHAQSTFNAFGDKSPNCPITDEGKSKCIEIQGSVDLVICSTLRRARETLDNSRLKYNRVIFTDLCREVMDGECCNYYNNEEHIIESEKDVNERIRKFKELLSLQPETLKSGQLKIDNPTIAVISHGIFLSKLTGLGYFNCQCRILDINTT